MLTEAAELLQVTPCSSSPALLRRLFFVSLLLSCAAPHGEACPVGRSPVPLDSRLPILMTLHGGVLPGVLSNPLASPQAVAAAFHSVGVPFFRRRGFCDVPPPRRSQNRAEAALKALTWGTLRRPEASWQPAGPGRKPAGRSGQRSQAKGGGRPARVALLFWSPPGRPGDRGRQEPAGLGSPDRPAATRPG